MKCFFLSQAYFYHKKVHIKWDIVISSSLRLLMKVWIWYRYQNRIGNYYHQDEKQLGFYKNVHRAWENHRYQKTEHEQKKGCSCNFTSQETNEF